jgi:FMN phosphatase YigB (HAD superfamily)
LKTADFNFSVGRKPRRKVRAVIVDIYHTLLEVGPPPRATAQGWGRMWRRLGIAKAPLTLAEFDQTCHREVAEFQLAAWSRGIAFPEVRWPEIARAAAPALARLPESTLNGFLYEHARLTRTVRLMPGAADVLSQLADEVVLGLCSNCQLYTLEELRHCLAEAGLSMEIFHPRLRFYSFEAGFKKPNPLAFRLLQQTLAVEGVHPEQILMVGDRLDNDILPAAAQGWRTWQLLPVPSPEHGGSWCALGQNLLNGSRASISTNAR